MEGRWIGSAGWVWSIGFDWQRVSVSRGFSVLIAVTPNSCRVLHLIFVGFLFISRRGIESALGETGTGEAAKWGANVQVGRHGSNGCSSRDGHFRAEAFAAAGQGRTPASHAGTQLQKNECGSNNNAQRARRKKQKNKTGGLSILLLGVCVCVCVLSACVGWQESRSDILPLRPMNWLFLICVVLWRRKKWEKSRAVPNNTREYADYLYASHFEKKRRRRRRKIAKAAGGRFDFLDRTPLFSPLPVELYFARRTVNYFSFFFGSLAIVPGGRAQIRVD